MKIFCKQCGKEFNSDHANVRYCSDSCRRKHDNEQKKRRNEERKKAMAPGDEIKVCPNCGERFVAIRERTTFCSPQCEREFRKKNAHGRKPDGRELPEIPCKMCGKMFKPKSHLNVYCSMTCQYEYASKVRSREENSKEHYQRICSDCGKLFTTVVESKHLCRYCAARKTREDNEYIDPFIEMRMRRASKSRTPSVSLHKAANIANANHVTYGKAQAVSFDEERIVPERPCYVPRWDWWNEWKKEI